MDFSAYRIIRDYQARYQIAALQIKFLHSDPGSNGGAKDGTEVADVFIRDVDEPVVADRKKGVAGKDRATGTRRLGRGSDRSRKWRPALRG